MNWFLDPANYSPDFPADALTNPVVARQYLKSKGYDIDSSFGFKKPNIEGGYVFHKAWTICEDIVRQQLGIMKGSEGKEALAPIVSMAMEGLESLQNAHVITIDPAQVEAIPGFDNVQEAVDYGRHVRLPFDHVFIDMETPVKTYVCDERVEVLGVFVKKKDYGIEITPVCAAVRDDPFAVRYLPRGQILIASADNELSPPHYTVLDEAPGIRAPRIAMSLTFASLYIKGYSPDDEITFDSSMADTFPPDPCHLIQYELPESNDTTYLLGAAQMLAGFHTALQVLFFLDTPNIEIASAQVSRQVRRAAERRGATISSTVWVRHNQRRYEARSDHDDPNRIEYSHQFEVRGHWKYYPDGTKMADARPDLLSYVPGRGMCRKNLVPEFREGRSRQAADHQDSAREGRVTQFVTKWEHECGGVHDGGKNPPDSCSYCFQSNAKGWRQLGREIAFGIGPGFTPKKKRSRTKGRTTISAGKRQRIYKRDGWCCVMCRDSPATRKLTIDHWVPVVKGGYQRR